MRVGFARKNSVFAMVLCEQVAGRDRGLRGVQVDFRRFFLCGVWRLVCGMGIERWNSPVFRELILSCGGISV